jgi:hypothetical protein
MIKPDYHTNLEIDRDNVSVTLRPNDNIVPAKGLTPEIPYVLVPREVWFTSSEMSKTLRLQDCGKLYGQSLMATDDCPATTGRLFVIDHSLKTQFLVDTASELCVYPRTALITDELQPTSNL